MKVIRIFSRRANARPSALKSEQYQSLVLHPSFVNLYMPQNPLLVPLINEPIRVNIFSFVIYKRGNLHYPKKI